MFLEPAVYDVDSGVILGKKFTTKLLDASVDKLNTVDPKTGVRGVVCAVLVGDEWDLAKETDNDARRVWIG